MWEQGTITMAETKKMAAIFSDPSAWNGRSPSRQMRLISYSGNQKLLQIR